jgi:hypothetical protein
MIVPVIFISYKPDDGYVCVTCGWSHAVIVLVVPSPQATLKLYVPLGINGNSIILTVSYAISHVDRNEEGFDDAENGLVVTGARIPF